MYTYGVHASNTCLILGQIKKHIALREINMLLPLHINSKLHLSLVNQ